MFSILFILYIFELCNMYGTRKWHKVKKYGLKCESTIWIIKIIIFLTWKKRRLNSGFFEILLFFLFVLSSSNHFIIIIKAVVFFSLYFFLLSFTIHCIQLQNNYCYCLLPHVVATPFIFWYMKCQKQPLAHNKINLMRTVTEVLRNFVDHCAVFMWIII